jgi:hypothetical protein
MLNVWYTTHMEHTFSVCVTREAMTRLLPTLDFFSPRRIVYPQFWLITLWDFNDIVSAQKVIDPSIEWDEGMAVYEEWRGIGHGLIVRRGSHNMAACYRHICLSWHSVSVVWGIFSVRDSTWATHLVISWITHLISQPQMSPTEWLRFIKDIQNLMNLFAYFLSLVVMSWLCLVTTTGQCLT